MKNVREVVIVSAQRTALGGFGGALKNVPATKLGSIAIEAVIEKAGIEKEQVDEVIMGVVLPADMGQAPARQAALGAGLPETVETMTINKVCGSGLKTVMLAAQAIALGDADVVVAGGMENMSQAPFYMDSLRFGKKMGHGQTQDALIRDGLWDVYNNVHMGSLADACAEKYEISRQEQDRFATQSYTRAQAAQEQGLFADEITPVVIPQRRGEDIIFNKDEEPGRVKFEKISTLRPAFAKEGSVTAANASTINDGAAAVLLMAAETAEELGLKPMARIVAQASAAKAPADFTIAPTDAVNKVLKKAALTTNDIDLYEINEAFSVVSLVNNQLLKINEEKVNVNGGAVAIGHPLGASGARILVTLLHALKSKKMEKGLASLCIGGGEASALVVENIQ